MTSTRSRPLNSGERQHKGRLQVLERKEKQGKNELPSVIVAELQARFGRLLTGVQVLLAQRDSGSKP